MQEYRPNAYLAWSGGKDSTVMTHLVCVKFGFSTKVMSIKDDCDYPGEEKYIKELASKWGIDLDVIKPKISLQELVKKLEIEVGEDVHSRNTEFAYQAFYRLIEQYRTKMKLPGVYLGLRKSESKYRASNFDLRGHIYKKNDGEVVCQPIVDWSDIEIFAYLFSHNIDPFVVYKCCRLHSSPGELRKSWWLGGKGGHNIWLRTYWPSLFMKLKKIVYGAGRVA